MMARLAALLAAALCLATCNAPPTASQRDWPAPSPALWEIGPQDAPAGWLFGTVHSLPGGANWHTPALDAALAKSDLLVVEIADLDDAAAGQKAFEAISEQAGLPPLEMRVAPADRPGLRHLLEAAGLEESAFADRKTWAAALMLAAATRHDDPGNGVDRELLEGAHRVEGLESFAAQYTRFDRLSPPAQAQLLLSVADDALADDPAPRIEAWLTGDLARLEQLSEGRLMADPDLRAKLVTERNRAWAARIGKLVASGKRPFVAVGAGHMLGTDGLPTLLAAQGLTVRRVQQPRTLQ